MLKGLSWHIASRSKGDFDMFKPKILRVIERMG